MKKIIIACLLTAASGVTAQINRKAVVMRNNPVITAADSLSSLSVGNGHFAVTVDITGLQSFPEFYKEGIPLCAMSDWGWHSFPNTQRLKPEETLKVVDTGNGHPSALYAVEYKNKNGKEERQKAATEYFRANPHRLNLGETGLEFYDTQHRRIGLTGIKHPIQSLNMWTGRIYSMYNVCGQGVAVQTAVHPEQDCEMFKIESSLLKKGQIAIALRFPYPSGKHSDDGADWSKPTLHETEIVKKGSNYAIIKRTIDDTLYYIMLTWNGNAQLTTATTHLLRLMPTKDNSGYMEVTVEYLCGTPAPFGKSPDIYSHNRIDYKKGIEDVANHWQRFWNEGAIADFSDCKDSRAKELERRVVLSQYLTAINCANQMPPQESGLTYNTWFGRPHLEMTWWHTLDFSLWNHPEYLQNILSWYDKAYQNAKEIAERQGYKGVRWMKMTDPWVGESPSGVGSFLIWQQPHYIYLAEELYRRSPANGILNRYADKVFATADFMADFVTYDSISGKYNIKGATAMQESKDWKTTYNQPFDIQYWRYGLTTAQKWRERMGLGPNALWDKIIKNLADLPERNGIYTAGNPIDKEDSTFLEKSRSDHPAVLGAYGLLPDYGNIDRSEMTKTFQWVHDNWNWITTWGWDYGMTAMTAARLGLPEEAVNALLQDTQKNTYLKNGHNYQDDRLRVYLPGNGALLTATAMMLAGWDGCPNIKNPGFPQNGKWNVKWEGINKMQ